MQVAKKALLPYLWNCRSVFFLVGQRMVVGQIFIDGAFFPSFSLSSTLENHVGLSKF
jgi:hypothetical protein